MAEKKRVYYFYDDEVGDYLYAINHPMKPHRIRMAHNLVLQYKLHPHMHVEPIRRATATDMTRFHTDEYIQFLQMASPLNTQQQSGVMDKFNVGEDSPVFAGVYEFCQISAGGSICGAEALNEGKADIAINWAGGLHHAKKAEASGFCYVADCVLGILKLLERFQRVMYIDIDIHHGDGVEEAFYTSDRVLTVSFHKYGEYFPGTGALGDIGIGQGKYYAINVPLNDGITDDCFVQTFKSVIGSAIEWYRPEAILLQCGADSLRGDRLGSFNLTIKGHGSCVKYVKSFGIPTLVTGGGGYTVRNVARCWAYETAVVLDMEDQLDNDLPFTDYLGYYGPDYKLHLQPSNKANQNSPEYLQHITETILDNIKHAPPTPCVGMAEDDPCALLQDSDTTDCEEEGIEFFPEIK